MLSGGKVYKQGSHRYIEDTTCIFKDNKTFCRYIDLNINDITAITLYHDKSTKFEITSFSEITNVVGKLGQAKGTVTSTYKGKGALSLFLTELTANNTVLDILPNSTLHTITPVMTWKTKHIYGVSLTYTVESKKPTSYHIFSEVCSSNILDYVFTQQSFNKFAKEIKDALDTIHHLKFHHNNINPNNIVFCANSNKFKFIDWTLSMILPNKPYHMKDVGTKFFTHPLKSYLAGVPKVIAIRLMNYSTFMGQYKWVKKLKAFHILQSFSSTSLEYILSRYNKLSSKQLHQQFAPYYDNYALGLTLILLAEKNNIKAPKDIVDELLKQFMPTTE